jgi:V-type H+-transporting ATPase subunit a
MFGDVGHGLINMLVGLMMVIFSKKLANVHNDMIEMLFEGRYLILLMSCFSILVGLIYNDFFAMGFNLFGSHYQFEIEGSKASAPFNKVISFGIDAHWHWTETNMMFLNSYKMKTAVVIGVSQMLFGLILKLINLIHKKEYAKLFCVWIPEFSFMAGFFGYMVFCIIYKWM